MPDIPTNRLQAASMQSSISSYVATAALAVLAGAVALFTYASQTFRLHRGFYWLMGAGLVFLVASLVFGGAGSAIVAKKVNDGTWNSSTKVSEYNSQAWFSLIGLLLILVGTGVGLASPPQSSDTDTRIHRLSREVSTLKQEVENLGQQPGARAP